jgi:outer membrane protein TolC
MQTGFTQYFFKGGSVIYGAAEAKHQYRAATAASKGTINDILNDTTQLYYDLVLADVLLQVQVKTVEVAKAFVIVQEDQFANGANTKLDVLQAKYELSKDRQGLISQQIKRRQAAVNLATILNFNPATDLVIGTKHVSKTRLVDEKLLPGDLIRIAIDHRPELKRFEELRLAAKDAVKVARAALLPTVAGMANIIGTGSRATSLSSTSSNQQTPLSGSGVGVGSASSGALPLAPGPVGSARRFSTQSLGVIGVDVQYNLGGLGWTELAKVQAARYDARKAQLEFNRELTKIYQEVRDSYLQSLEAEQLIIETTDAVTYAEESLRVSEVRLKNGVATYLDLITAQRNYTAALTDKANAIIKFNVAQAAVVHAVGRATVDTLTATTPMRN